MPLTAQMLGERIRQAISDAAMTQQQAAAVAQMDPTALCKALQGKRNFSTLEIGRICEALHLSPMELLSDGAPPADPCARDVARVRWMAELDALLTELGYPPRQDHAYPATLLDRAAEAWLAGHVSIRPIAGLIGADAEDLLAGLPLPRRPQRSPWIPDAQDGLPPRTYPSWRALEIRRRAGTS